MLGAEVIGYVVFATMGALRPGSMRRIGGRTLEKSVPSIIAVSALMTMSFVLRGSGQAEVLAYVLLGTTTAGILGKEGEVLKVTLPLALLIGAVIGLVALVSMPILYLGAIAENGFLEVIGFLMLAFAMLSTPAIKLTARPRRKRGLLGIGVM